jgi:hypothetical protein
VRTRKQPRALSALPPAIPRMGHNGGPPTADVDIVDPVRVVADLWNWSEDSIMREVARKKLKLTRLGPRRKGIRRSEQRRYLDAHTDA